MSRWYDSLVDLNKIRKEKAKKKEGRVKAAERSVARDGRSMASKLERDVYEMLKLMQRCGEIRNLKCQVQVHLTLASILYKPDFAYETKSGVTEYVEAKGFETETWRIKRRLWMHYGLGPLHVYTKQRGEIILKETIQVKRDA